MKLKKKIIQYRGHILLFLFTLLFMIVYLAPSIFVTVYPGEVGVLFRRFFGGTVLDRIYEEGFHIISPWNKMYHYNYRIQRVRHTVHVLSTNGLTIQVTVSVRFHILKERAPLLHQRVGPDYLEKVIVPSTISSVREVIGKYRPDEIYSGSARYTMQDEILIETVKETARIPIVYDSVIIEIIKLPDLVNSAIELKLRKEQEFLEYEFRLKKAHAEVERKRIEARGIKLYQETISQSLDPEILQWLGVFATLRLAESPNSKVVIAGGRDGLPIILDTETSAPRPFPPSTESETKPGEGSFAEPPPSDKPEPSALQDESKPVVQETPPKDFASFLGSVTSFFENLKKMNMDELLQKSNPPPKGP